MTNAIQFWLSYDNGKEQLRLPVNPESISMSSPFGYEDIAVQRLGEYTVIHDRGLREFSFSSFFPRDYNEGYCEYSDMPEPSEAVSRLERWRDEKKSIRLTVTGTKVNTLVTLRELESEVEKSGSPGDIYYSMTLKEYRPISIRKIEESKTAVSSSSSPPVTVSSQDKRPSDKPKEDTYTVKSGDTLYKIAARPNVLGDGSKWRDLYNTNKSVIGDNPNVIKPGQKLVIPDV